MPLRVIKVQLGTVQGGKFSENPSRFEQCVESVSKRGGVRSPAGVCAAAGRKKYGKKKFAAMAKAGRKRAAKKRNSVSYSVLARIIENRYGVGPLAASPTTVIWAAQHLAQDAGVTRARAELSALNRRREKAGVSPAYPQYGSPLFKRNGKRGLRGRRK